MVKTSKKEDTRADERLKMQQEAADLAEKRARFAQDANDRAAEAATRSSEAASERSRVDQLANEGISIFNKGEDGFNKFLETLSPQDQGIVLTEVKQFRDKTPTESKLTAGAIADIMMKRDGNKGPTFGEYLNELRKAQASGKIEERTGNKYVVKGWRNDIDKIPAFEELIRQFPQFKVLPDEGQETDQKPKKLPGGGTLTVKPT